MSERTPDYQGHCYCGAVTVTVLSKEPPLAAGYCHCLSCRKSLGAPFNAWTIWPADSVNISGGEVIRSTFNKASRRVSCAACGGALANEKPEINMTVVYAMSLAESDFKFEPTMHSCYAERAMDIDDGLPKFVDFPEGFGGSGKVIEKVDSTGWCA